jgi:hypothetical protein
VANEIQIIVIDPNELDRYARARIYFLSSPPLVEG